MLLPGLDATGALYDDFEAALPDDWRLTVLSYPSDEPLDYDALLPRIREQLPTDGRWVLLGESFSGPLAVRIAAEQPRGLAALVLCATFAARPVPIPWWLVPTLAFRVTPPRALMRRLMLEDSAPDAAVTEFIDALATVEPSVLATRARAALRADVRLELASLTLPVLYLRAARDRLFGPGVHALAAAQQPQMRTEVVEGAPHLVLQRCPTAAARAIVDGLDALGA